MIANHTELTEDATRRYKEELAAIDRFCLFMDKFEQTGLIQGVPHTLVGISQHNYVARFKSEDGEYFFDGNKKPHQEAPNENAAPISNAAHTFSNEAITQLPDSRLNGC